jgi:DNA polymerase-1
MAAPLILVDGSSYLYRAFHALPPLNNSRGEPTGAVFGVLNMLQKFLREQAESNIVVVFDAPGKTFRDDLFAEYKAHRPPMPDDLRSQIEPLLAAVSALGLPMLRIPGVEADDVIGTLACRAAARGESVVISTGDKDMAQLVNDRITLINTMSNTRMDRDGVKAKFDVWPEQIIDYLALIGDSSDNIPGIDKVGPKTAAKWLATWPTLDDIIAHAAEISGKVGENLRAGLETLALSRQLATIRVDLDLPPDLAAATRQPADTAKLRELYMRMEFRGLLKALEGSDGGAASPAATPGAGTAGSTADSAASTSVSASAGEPPAPAAPALPRDYESITTPEALQRWMHLIDKAALTAFDTETTSLDYSIARIVGMSFCVEAGKAAYLPLAHRYAGAPDQLDLDATLALLKPWLESERHAKLGHHLKYDAHVLRNHGINLAGMRHDSMLESYVLEQRGHAPRHGFGGEAVPGHRHHQVRGRGRQGRQADRLRPGAGGERHDLRRRRRRRDAAHARGAVAADWWPSRNCARCTEDIEQPLSKVLLEMEHHGVLLDAALLRKQSGELGLRMRELQGLAHAAAGGEFNLDSPKQLQEILFEKMQLPVIRKTPTGQPSTAEDVLEELAGDYESAAADPGIPRPCEAEVHLHRQAARADRSDHRPRAHQLPPGRGRHGPAVFDGSEPAEHPDPHAGRPAHPPGLHRAAGLRADGRGLFADRAAHHGASVGRCGRWCARSRRIATCTRPPPPKCWARSPKTSRPTSAARPRRSTSA